MKKLFLFLLLFSAFSVVGVITNNLYAQPKKTVLITGDTTKFFSYGTKGNTVEFGATDTSRAAIRLPRVAHPDSIKTPRKGMIVYCTVDSALYLRQNFGWQKVSNTASNGLRVVGSDFRLGNILNENSTINGQNNYRLHLDSLTTFRAIATQGSAQLSAYNGLVAVGGNTVEISSNNGDIDIRAKDVVSNVSVVSELGDINITAPGLYAGINSQSYTNSTTANVIVNTSNGRIANTASDSILSTSPLIKYIASDSTVFLTPKYVHRYTSSGQTYTKNVTPDYFSNPIYEKTTLSNAVSFAEYSLETNDDGDFSFFKISANNVSNNTEYLVSPTLISSYAGTELAAPTTVISQGSTNINTTIRNSFGIQKLSLTLDSTGIKMVGANAALYLNGSAGTAGQVVMSDGIGSAPYWGTVSGGGGDNIYNANGTLGANRVLNGGRKSLHLGSGVDSMGNLDLMSINTNHGFNINDGEGGTIATTGKNWGLTGLGHVQFSGVDSVTHLTGGTMRLNAIGSMSMNSNTNIKLRTSSADRLSINNSGDITFNGNVGNTNAFQFFGAMTRFATDSTKINTTTVFDTTLYKPTVQSASGLVAKLGYWPSTGGGGTTWGSITGTLSSQTDLQTLLNAKLNTASPSYTGTMTTPLTASRLAIIGGSNELTTSTVTSTEAGYLSGVTSAIQTQINAKATGTITSSTAGQVAWYGAAQTIQGTAGLLYNGTHFAVGGYNGASVTRALIQVTGTGTYSESIFASGTISTGGSFAPGSNIGMTQLGGSGSTYYGFASGALRLNSTIGLQIHNNTSVTNLFDASGNMSIGASSINASTALDVVSTTKGVRLTPMTRTLANAIPSKATGLELYSTTDSCKLIWNGTKFMYIGKSGTYVPTYTSTANIASTVVTEISYEINGDMLTITGEVEFGVTATLTPTELRISLPSYVTNNFTATNFGGGVTYNDAANNIFTITPVSGTTLIAFKAASPNLTTSYKYPFTVSFRIP